MSAGPERVQATTLGWWQWDDSATFATWRWAFDPEVHDVRDTAATPSLPLRHHGGLMGLFKLRMRMEPSRQWRVVSCGTTDKGGTRYRYDLDQHEALRQAEAWLNRRFRASLREEETA